MDKKYSANGKTCTVTVKLPAEAAHDANSVVVLGDFNNWDPGTGIALKPSRDGSFEGKLKLETGRNYEFRILVNGNRWENAWDADAYVPSPYSGVDNCVINLPYAESSTTEKATKPEPAAKKTTEKPTAKKMTAKKATAKKATQPTDTNDLTKIEGIGPKIAQLLNEGGVKTYDDLAKAKPAKLKAVLEKAGSRYRMHDPATWSEQAKLAAKGEWEKLKTLQVELKGGKRK